MKNVLERFDKVVDLAYKVNKKIYDNNYEESSGYGPRFRKMLHKNGNRIHSLGIFDYHTKKYVLFEMVNMVGQKNKVPNEFNLMEQLIRDGEPN